MLRFLIYLISISIIFICVSSTHVFAEDITPESIIKLNKDAEKLSKEIQEPQLPQKDSKEYKAALEAAKIQIESIKKSPAGTNQIISPSPPPQDSVYLFISSSMPLATLKNYAKEIHNKKLPVKMILRGFIDGNLKIKPTLDFIQSFIVEGDKGLNVSVEIDPLLFRRYNIEEVPTFIKPNNVSLIDLDLSAGLESNNRNPADGIKLSGDVSIEYAIEKIMENK